MKRYVFIFLALVFISIFPLSGAMAGGRTIIKHFDKNQNITGYSVIENDRESKFDRDWNRTGYAVPEGNGRIDHFDSDWRRQGRSEIDDYEKKQNTE